MEKKKQQITVSFIPSVGLRQPGSQPGMFFVVVSISWFKQAKYDGLRREPGMSQNRSLVLRLRFRK